MDRRGRGASGDSPEDSLGKEAQDIAAVVESRPGSRCGVWGDLGTAVSRRRSKPTFLTEGASAA